MRQRVYGRVETTDLDSPPVPPLVGREEELARLLKFLEGAAHGAGRVVLLRGELGIGKTRLGQEVLARARERGFIALVGQSYPLEEGLAYAPIVAAFGPLLRHLDPDDRNDLTQGLSDLGRLFPELQLPRPEPLDDSALEKTRLYEAFSCLLHRLAQRAPIIIFLDDLHWADAASLELLQYLGHGLGEAAILLLGTYRSDEADAVRRLRPLLISLRRAGVADELDIARVTSTEMAALAHSVLGGAASDELLALLEARAAGTPLFAAAIIDALRDARRLVETDRGWTVRGDVAALPTHVRDLILDRLDRLNVTERRVLDRIAVGGGTTSHDLLQAVCELDNASLSEALDWLLAHGFIAEVTADGDIGYALTHPLLQEVAYSRLSSLARRRAHLAYTRALERLRPDELALLATHYRAAGSGGDRERALEVFVAAGEGARGVYANEEAARHYQAALDLIRQGRQRDLLPQILERLGEAWERLGESAATISIWSEALEAYERADDSLAVARLHRLLALATWESGRHAGAAQAHLAAGITALEGQRPSPELAELYLLQAVILTRCGDVEGAVAIAQRLRDLAEQLRSPRVVARAELALMRPYLLRGDFVEGREAGLRALALVEDSEEIALVQQVHYQLSLVIGALGDHKRAQRHGEESLQLARRLGAPALEAIAHAGLIQVDLFAGNWDEALRYTDEALAAARHTGQGRAAGIVLAARAQVLLLKGELAAAEQTSQEAREWLAGDLAASYYAEFPLHSQVALALERGDVERLRALVPQVTGQAVVVYPQVLGIVVESQLAVGDVEGALAQIAKVRTAGDMRGPFAAAMATRLEGLARDALEERAAARTLLAEAVDAFRGLEIPFEAARAQLEWAACSTGDDAVAAARESLEVFERLGAKRYADRARKTLRRLGVRPRPARRPGPDGGPLSRRELEVARLVAEGLTTAQVAARLIISPHTADTHLRRIYDRLDIHSRAALARYLTESGLL